MERANVPQSLLIPTGVLAGVRLIRLGSAKAVKFNIFWPAGFRGWNDLEKAALKSTSCEPGFRRAHGNNGCVHINSGASRKTGTVFRSGQPPFFLWRHKHDSPSHCCCSPSAQPSKRKASLCSVLLRRMPRWTSDTPLKGTKTLGSSRQRSATQWNIWFGHL